MVNEILDNFDSDKERFLEKLNKIEGVFVPKFGKKKVKKRYVKDFENSYYPERPLVPYIQVIMIEELLRFLGGVIEVVDSVFLEWKKGQEEKEA